MLWTSWKGLEALWRRKWCSTGVLALSEVLSHCDNGSGSIGMGLDISLMLSEVLFVFAFVCLISAELLAHGRCVRERDKLGGLLCAGPPRLRGLRARPALLAARIV